MFKIDQKVRKTITGEQQTGIVTGILKASKYAQQARQNGFALTAWTQQFPTWEEGLVYYVDFFQPAKAMRLDEVITQHPEFSLEEAKNFYDSLPLQNAYACVEADLIPVSAIN